MHDSRLSNVSNGTISPVGRELISLKTLTIWWTSVAARDILAKLKQEGRLAERGTVRDLIVIPAGQLIGWSRHPTFDRSG
jgi:hypothetical protein